MKKKGFSMKHRKILLTICFIGIIFNLLFTALLHDDLTLKINGENNEDIDFKTPRTSYFNNSASPIFINDLDISCDWEWARNQSWCEYKNGTYCIENLTINGQNSSNCITIVNSTKNFIINNCTLYNASSGDLDNGAAIALANVSNGIVSNSNCSYYQRVGIAVINSSNNNQISGNLVTNNVFTGIIVFNNGSGNIINGNMVYDNPLGIVVAQNCINSEIMNNNLFNNSYDGIWISSSNNTQIFENRLINNAGGIQLEGNSNNNQIYANLIQENSKGVYSKVNCFSNEIFSNSFIKNGIHAIDNGTDNQWNGTIGGNYWDNHTALDPDHDGIINSAFDKIEGTNNLAIDSHPLWQSPIHVGGKIHIDESSGNAPNWNRTAELTQWCSGSGSISEPYTIKNLEIDANYSGSGILIENSIIYVLIENCIVHNANDSGSDAGIRVESSNNITVLDNICLNNLNFGIFFGGGCKNNSILKNHIEGNSTKTGIFLADGCNNNTIFNNTITLIGNDTTSTGMFLLVYCYNNKILDNNVNRNAGIGIQLSGHCSNNTILGNTVSENQLNGITIIGQSNNNTISGNEVNLNVLHGIYLYDRNTNNTLSGNTANENENGILLEGLCNNNTISGNTASNNRESGIKLMDFCLKNTISENTAEHNGQNGIHLFYSHNNTISNNGQSFNHNGFRGIYLEYSDYNDIINNVARYNEYGIYLSWSHNNIIRDNDFRSNYDFWVQFDGNNENNTFSGNIYADPPGAPPIDIITVIIIIIIISSILIALGGVYAYKRKQKVITVQGKGVSSKKTHETTISDQTIGLKKKKHKLDETAPISLDLTEIEKEEIEQTESELDIEKSEFICIVHKGTIDGAVYICPNCKTFYCVRCANALKEKGEKCWSCESDINVSITDNVISENEQKIQELQSRIESIKKTVQTLDESFYSGAISEEIYSQSREPLMKKITALIEEIEQLKS